MEPSLLLSDLDQDLEINRKNISTANVPYQSSQKSSNNTSGVSNEKKETELDSLAMMRQISKQSSGNDRGLHVEITKKLNELNLKSPKAAKNIGWMGLVEDALGIEDLDEDEEERTTSLGLCCFGTTPENTRTLSI